jgi:hypothetical protein
VILLVTFRAEGDQRFRLEADHRLADPGFVIGMIPE